MRKSNLGKYTTSTGTGAVDSVNGKTGTVVLDQNDVGAAPTIHSHSQYVNDSTNQSIDGIKTFVKSPIIPTPTTQFQATPKGYVDLNQTNTEDLSLKATAKSLNDLNGRIQALEEFINRSAFDSLQVSVLNVVSDMNMFKNSNLIKVGTPRIIGFDFATGGTFTLTVDGVTTASIIYTNASTYASVTTQITDALTAIGKTIALGYSVINGTTYILLRRDYNGETTYNYTITDASGKVKKTASPIDAPDFVGQFYIDNISATPNSWQAMNVNSVSDWKQITN